MTDGWTGGGGRGKKVRLFFIYRVEYDAGRSVCCGEQRSVNRVNLVGSKESKEHVDVLVHFRADEIRLV
jgi:hypothetical protein